MSRPHARTAGAIVVAVGLVLAVLAFGTASSSHHVAGAAPVVRAGGPTGTSIAGAVGGSAERERVVRALAVRVVASSGALLHSGPIGRRELVRGMFVDEALDGQVDALTHEMDAIASRLGVNPDSLVWLEQPLTARVALDGDRAHVSVWSVVVFGSDTSTRSGPAAAPTVLWRTSEVDLVERDGAWRATDITATAGPTPATDDAARVDGFARFRDVATWPAAAAGGGS